MSWDYMANASMKGSRAQSPTQKD